MKTNEITNFNKNMKQRFLNMIQECRDFEYKTITDFCKELNIDIEKQRNLSTKFDNLGRTVFEKYRLTEIENFKQAIQDKKITTENNVVFHYEDKLIFTFDKDNNVYEVALVKDIFHVELIYLENFEDLNY